MVAIVPLTRAAPKNPLHLPLDARDTGLDSPSTVLVDQARFIDRSRLRTQAGGLTAFPQVRLDRNLARVLGLGTAA